MVGGATVADLQSQLTEILPCHFFMLHRLGQFVYPIKQYEGPA